jgi:hypothetical protein
MAALAGDLTKALLGQTDAAKAFRYTLKKKNIFGKMLRYVTVCKISNLAEHAGYNL